MNEKIEGLENQGPEGRADVSGTEPTPASNEGDVSKLGEEDVRKELADKNLENEQLKKEVEELKKKSDEVVPETQPEEKKDSSHQNDLDSRISKMEQSKKVDDYCLENNITSEGKEEIAKVVEEVPSLTIAEASVVATQRLQTRQNDGGSPTPIKMFRNPGDNNPDLSDPKTLRKEVRKLGGTDIA